MRFIVSLIILLSIIIPISGVAASPGLSVSSTLSSHVLLPGGEYYLILTIKNIGTQDINNLYVTLEGVDSPIKIQGIGNPRYVSTLKQSGQIQSVYRLSVPEDTPVGTYLARFKVTQLTAGTAGEENMVYVYNAIIKVSGFSNLIISSVSPALYVPGQKTDLVFTLKNKGNARLRNIKLTWNTPEDVLLPLQRDSQVTIPLLSPQKKVNISMPVIAKMNIAPDVYPITFTVSYYLNGEEETTKDVVGIIIGGTTNFGVSTQMTSPESLAITVANIGINPADSVSVKIGHNEAFIGNIDAGDYSIANIMIPEVSERNNSLQQTSDNGFRMENSRVIPKFQAHQGLISVQISYTDTMGERHSVIKEVSVEHTSQTVRGQMIGAPLKGHKSNNTLYAAVIGILLLLGVIYGYKKKREASR